MNLAININIEQLDDAYIELTKYNELPNSKQKYRLTSLVKKILEDSK